MKALVHKRRAAFFDMDRTVLRIDTGMSWMRFLYRRGELSLFGLGRALYWAVLYKMAILDMDALAKKLVSEMAGESERSVIEKHMIWINSDVEGQVADRAREAIEHHRDAGDLLVLLTGAHQYSAEVIAESLAIEHTLCTRLEVTDGVFTGKLGQMCHGVHKVTLAEAFAAAHGIDLESSVFYSDSYNDLPMLQRVGVPVVVNPDSRLRRHARRTGWRVESWI